MRASVPQMPTARGETRTSPAPGRGTGREPSARRPTPSKRTQGSCPSVTPGSRSSVTCRFRGQRSFRTSYLGDDGSRPPARGPGCGVHRLGGPRRAAGRGRAAGRRRAGPGGHRDDGRRGPGRDGRGDARPTGAPRRAGRAGRGRPSGSAHPRAAGSRAGGHPMARHRSRWGSVGALERHHPHGPAIHPQPGRTRGTPTAHRG